MGKCCEQLKKIIRKVDFFGTFITFRVNEEIEYKSIIGGIFTLIYGIISLSYVSIMAINFIGRKNIDFIYSKTIHQHPVLNLSKVGFNFAFGAQYSKTAVPAIKNSKIYFDYNVNLIESLSNNNISGKSQIINTPIGIRRCEEDDFPELKEHYFLNDLHFMYCPILNSSSNFSIEGLYTGSYYKYLSIKISLTQYALDNFQEIKDFLEKTPIDIAIFYKDTALNYLNRYNPLPSYLNYYYKGIDPEFYKTSEISFSRLEFSSDENILFERPKKIARPIHSTIHDNFQSINERKKENENGVCEFILHASSEVLDLKRTYEKITRFAANISGILGFLFFVLITLANYIERKAVDNKLIRKMLKFKGNKNINVDYFVQKFSQNLQFDLVLNKKSKCNSQQIKTYDNLLNQNTENNDSNDEIYNKTKKKIWKRNSFFDGINKINTESIPYQNSDEKEKKKIEKIIQKSNKKQYEIEFDKLNSNNSQRKILNKNTLDLDIQFFSTEELRKIKNPNTCPQNQKSKKQQNSVVKSNLCEIIINFLCFWCNPKSYRKRKLMQSAERKIYYYMDIITYVKTIQEFELLKEIIFDDYNLKLFQFAAKPTMKNLNGDFIFYHFFEKELNTFQNIGIKEIDDLYYNYKEILKQERTFQNLKLLNVIKGDVKFLQN